jgi:hypothetical protein
MGASRGSGTTKKKGRLSPSAVTHESHEPAKNASASARLATQLAAVVGRNHASVSVGGSARMGHGVSVMPQDETVFGWPPWLLVRVSSTCTNERWAYI